MPYGVCVWSTGNSTRPIVSSLVEQVPEQQAWHAGSNPKTAKLVVDPFLRVVGAKDFLALGDCSNMAGDRLPATAQVGLRKNEN